MLALVMRRVISSHLLALILLVLLLLKTSDRSETKLYVRCHDRKPWLPLQAVVFRLLDVLWNVSSPPFLGNCRPF